MPPMQPTKRPTPDWAVTGAKGRERRILTSIYLDPPAEEKTNLRLFKRWQEIQSKEVRYKEYFLDDAKFVVVGFGSVGRIALTAVRAARAEGIPVGLLRPITLSPFPDKIIDELSHKVQGVLVVEANTSQMLDDVMLASRSCVPVEFYGRVGGMLPMPDEILTEIKRMVKGPLVNDGQARMRWMQRMVQ